jgi:hypothetical protein
LPLKATVPNVLPSAAKTTFPVGLTPLVTAAVKVKLWGQEKFCVVVFAVSDRLGTAFWMVTVCDALTELLFASPLYVAVIV